MKIEYIEIAGFRGFKNKTRFTFPLGFAVITGRNGVGKSTAFDALDFALTGTISKYDVREAKGGGINDHLWWIGEGKAEEEFVSVGFVDDSGQALHITRGRDGLITSGNLEDLSFSLCSSALEMPTWANTLVRTSLIRDETISTLSMDLTEQARFSEVRTALGASDASDFSGRLREIVRLAETARDEQTARHSKAHEDLGRALTALTEARSVANRDEDVAEAQQLLETHLLGFTPGTSKIDFRSFLVDRRQKVEEMRTVIAQAEALVAERNSIETPDFLAELVALRHRESESEHSAAELAGAFAAASLEFSRASEIDQLLTSHLELLDIGEKVGLQDGHCPLCSAPHSSIDFQNAIAAARILLSAETPVAVKARSDLNAAQYLFDQTNNQLAELRQTISKLESRRARVRKDLETLEVRFSELGLGDIEHLDDASELLLRVQEDFSKLQQAVAVLESSLARDAVAKLSSRAEHLRAIVEEEAIRLNESERALDRSQQIEKTARIIVTELLSEKLDTVLPLLKELYRRLRPHADWREIEIDVAGQVRGSLNFTVGERKNPQFLFSSGQRRAAGLAFLLSLHLARPWCRLNTLMLDDPIQHVDDYRALNLVEVLSSIRRSGGRQVIVAVEDDALADVLCRRLRSNMREGGKRIELGINVDGSASIVGEMEIAGLSRAVFKLADAS